MVEHIEKGTLSPRVKAVIALTSWRKRINTVGLTIYNLFETCGPDYHIVLTLSEEEFPRKERELPRDLVLMNKTGVFEILYVRKNYKAFKKFLFAMQRYQTVPIISADDDCIYRFNYANELYNAWRICKSRRACYWCSNINKGFFNTSGYATIHPPYYYKDAYMLLTDDIIKLGEDDLFYAAVCKLYNHTSCTCLNLNLNDVAIIHDEECPLHDTYRKSTLSSNDRFTTMYNLVVEAYHEYYRK